MSEQTTVGGVEADVVDDGPEPMAIDPSAVTFAVDTTGEIILRVDGKIVAGFKAASLVEVLGTVQQSQAA